MSLFSSHEINRLLKPGNANDLQSTVEFLQSGEAQQFGMITEFKDSNPRFIHRCFAEYFAANWFAENYASCKNLILNHLFNSISEVVRNIFDRILAEDMLLHGAVLNSDMKAVSKLLKKETDVNCADKGGRTALHLAATYNRAVTQTVSSVPGVDINATDRVLKWTPLRYAAERDRGWLQTSCYRPVEKPTTYLLAKTLTMRSGDRQHCGNVCRRDMRSYWRSC
jgi:ankyrin repeat protein